jgi:hypothetical protein
MENIGQTPAASVPSVSSRVRGWWLRRSYRRLAAAQVFSKIYRTKAWGAHPDRPFCSGDGSIREDVVVPYCDRVRAFIQSHGIRQVVDLGCGDFGVGSQLLAPDLHYTAVDIVPELIEYNRRRFIAAGVEFKCLNIIEDDLPIGDVALVRQVLQHLSNTQITKVMQKLRAYKYVVATEHVYIGPGCCPNLDKPHGPGTRIPFRSGVFLDAAPFSYDASVLLELPMGPSEVLRTLVIDQKAASS